MARVSLTSRRGVVSDVVVDEVDLFLSCLKWFVNSNGYVMVMFEGRKIPLHRVITERMAGEKIDWSLGFMVDHIDGSPLNNSRSNLRVVSHAENMQNRRKPSQNTSGFKGITRSRGKWLAAIGLNGKLFHIGYFDTPDEAGWMYDQWAISLHGEYARLNFDYLPVEKVLQYTNKFV